MAENLAVDSRDPRTIAAAETMPAMEGRWLCIVKSYSRRTQIVFREAVQHRGQQKKHCGEQWRIDSE